MARIRKHRYFGPAWQGILRTFALTGSAIIPRYYYPCHLCYRWLSSFIKALSPRVAFYLGSAAEQIPEDGVSGIVQSFHPPDVQVFLPGPGPRNRHKSGVDCGLAQ